MLIFILNNRLISQNLGVYAREHENKLFIYYLQKEDAGEYECFLPDGRTSRVRLTVLKNANEPLRSGNNEHMYLDSSNQLPQAQVAYEPFLEKEVHENVVMNCGLVGDSQNELKWKKLEPVCFLFVFFFKEFRYYTILSTILET